MDQQTRIAVYRRVSQYWPAEEVVSYFSNPNQSGRALQYSDLFQHKKPPLYLGTKTLLYHFDSLFRFNPIEQFWINFNAMKLYSGLLGGKRKVIFLTHLKFDSLLADESEYGFTDMTGSTIMVIRQSPRLRHPTQDCYLLVVEINFDEIYKVKLLDVVYNTTKGKIERTQDWRFQ